MCWFEGIPIEALVDSGAEASVISSRVFKTLHSTSYSGFSPDPTTFKGIGGNQQSQGVANFTFAMGETEFTAPLHQQFELADGFLTLTNGEEIKLSHRERLNTIQVHAVKDTILPARTAQFLLTAPVGNPR